MLVGRNDVDRIHGNPLAGTAEKLTTKKEAPSSPGALGGLQLALLRLLPSWATLGCRGTGESRFGRACISTLPNPARAIRDGQHILRFSYSSAERAECVARAGYRGIRVHGLLRDPDFCADCGQNRGAAAALVSGDLRCYRPSRSASIAAFMPSNSKRALNTPCRISSAHIAHRAVVINAMSSSGRRRVASRRASRGDPPPRPFSCCPSRNAHWDDRRSRSHADKGPQNV
jgi:hypothetical protein